MIIAVLNKSKRFTDQGSLQRMALACSRQIRRHVAPAWGRSPAAVLAFSSPTDVPKGAQPIVLFDNANQAGVLGWHTEGPDGQVYGRVFVAPVLDHKGTLFEGSNSISAVLSHEVCEMFIDQSCGLWAEATDRLFAVEVCDPVENLAYEITDTVGPVSVSDFVYPEWFDAQAPAGSRFSHMNAVAAPFTLAQGGYAVTYKNGAVNEIFGDQYPAWKRDTKDFPAARTARRAGIVSRS